MVAWAVVTVGWSTVSSSGGAAAAGGIGAVGTFGIVNGTSGSNDPPTEITVADADVNGVRVVVRRPRQ